MKKLIGILLCAILLINGALAETGSILVDLKEPDRGTFPDPNTTVTFELYRIAVPNGSTESAWAPSLKGLELPEGKDWDYENDVVKLEQDAVAISHDRKQIEIPGRRNHECVTEDADVIQGIDTDRSIRRQARDHPGAFRHAALFHQLIELIPPDL